MTPARLSAISDGLFDGRNKPYVWERALFCWVTNCLHQYDIGGITPGSFCPAVRDAFDEGILIPPVKIVEGDCVRRDIEELYLRASRKPASVALDFRAQLAGNTTARDRIVALIRRYGAGTVKAVMKRILDNGERFIDARPVFRQFFCPGCGRLIENEVALEHDPVLHDIELAG